MIEALSAFVSDRDFPRSIALKVMSLIEENSFSREDLILP